MACVRKPAPRPYSEPMSPDSEPTPRLPWLPVNEGAKSPAPASPEPLTPTKPTVPAWIQRETVPQVVDADEDEVIAAVAQPPAEELLPRRAAHPSDTAPSLPDDGDIAPERSAATALWNSDPVHRLGDSAVASASLSAAGAPTPLGGVPLATPENPMTSPSFGEEFPLFTPSFAPQEAEQVGTPTEQADALAAGIVAHGEAQFVSSGSGLDAGVAYAPISIGDPAAAPVEEPTEPTPPSGKTRRRWWLLALLALIVVGAVVATLAVLNRPEAVVIPGVTVTEPPPSPTITPLPAPTASAFQSAMPTTVGTYSLVEATALDPEDISLHAGRVVDGIDLTYRSGDDIMKVRALQYYSEDDAKQMFTQFVGADVATEPVTAGGNTVGESAIITSPKPGMVWRNGTSVFILTGPLLQISDFYEQFGL